MKWRLVFGLLIANMAWGLSVPPLRSAVEDTAQILSGGARAQLIQVLESVKARGHAQIQVLTIPSLEGGNIDQYSIQVTDQWKLGTSKKDNGILLLVSVQDRKVRIEVGQGLEGDLPDATASRIVRQIITPAFQKSQYERGISQAIFAILEKVDPEALQNLEAAPEAQARRSGRGGPGTLVLLILMVILVSIFSRRTPGSGLRGGGGFMGGGGGFGGGFGGGSGGGWSGGGGGFSGGGSSGSW